MTPPTNQKKMFMLDEMTNLFASKFTAILENKTDTLGPWTALFLGQQKQSTN